MERKSTMITTAEEDFLLLRKKKEEDFIMILLLWKIEPSYMVLISSDQSRIKVNVAHVGLSLPRLQLKVCLSRKLERQTLMPHGYHSPSSTKSIAHIQEIKTASCKSMDLRDGLSETMDARVD